GTASLQLIRPSEPSGLELEIDDLIQAGDAIELLLEDADALLGFLRDIELGAEECGEQPHFRDTEGSTASLHFGLQLRESRLPGITPASQRGRQAGRRLTIPGR